MLLQYEVLVPFPCDIPRHGLHEGFCFPLLSRRKWAFVGKLTEDDLDYFTIHDDELENGFICSVANMYMDRAVFIAEHQEYQTEILVELRHLPKLVGEHR